MSRCARCAWQAFDVSSGLRKDFDVRIDWTNLFGQPDIETPANVRANTAQAGWPLGLCTLCLRIHKHGGETRGQRVLLLPSGGLGTPRPEHAHTSHAQNQPSLWQVQMYSTTSGWGGVWTYYQVLGGSIQSWCAIFAASSTSLAVPPTIF